MTPQEFTPQDPAPPQTFDAAGTGDSAGTNDPTATSAVVGYCRTCGKSLRSDEAKMLDGALYCPEHAPIPVAGPPGTSAAPPPLRPNANAYANSSFPNNSYPGAYPGAGPANPAYAAGVNSMPAGVDPGGVAPGAVVNPDAGLPGVAFLLGLIPGVGAVYNGQYAKGLMHVVIFGLIISILSNDAANGLEPLFGIFLAGFYCYMPFEAFHTARKARMGVPVDEFSSLVPVRGGGSRFPVAPVLLIAFGVLFLLNNLDILKMRDVVRYWPVLLIAMGGYLMYERLAERQSAKGDGSER
jgi:hypothetical protein